MVLHLHMCHYGYPCISRLYELLKSLAHQRQNSTFSVLRDRDGSLLLHNRRRRVSPAADCVKPALIPRLGARDGFGSGDTAD
jgi:hypothetical protein